MADFKLTPDQETAVSARGSALLVSAAAGSGKTRVLVERLMRHVADGADIDAFLVITYTRTAAAELRGRIQTELSRLCAADPENRRLRRQTLLCSRAQIGTIHSFCAALLRENAHLLGLAPDFRVADEDRAGTLKAVVLEKVLDEAYEDLEGKPGLKSLVDTVGAGRDDSRLASLLLEIHTVLKSHPYPERWIGRQLGELSGVGVCDAGQTVWGETILRYAGDRASYWARRLDALLAELLSPENGKVADAYGASLACTRAALGEFRLAARQGWEAARAALPIPFPRLKPVKGADALAERVKTARGACKKSCGELETLLAGDSATLLGELRGLYPAMEALLRLAMELDAAFAAEKRRQGLLDFSDLEHLSLRILEDADSGEPTALARTLAERYTEILVDEYQDVSEIQDRLLRALSREGRSLFMVGDVKQSIYRFRLAEPGIFLDKLLRYGGAGADEGRRVLLRENFRSRGSVIKAVNHVFRNLMSVRLGELDYDEDAALRQGKRFPEAGETPVEFRIYAVPEAGGEEEGPDRTEWEAAMVARQIRALVEGGALIAPEGAPRRVDYGDIVVLLRSPGPAGETYREALEREGIPTASRQGGGFFQSLEVTVLLSVLAVIDNPRQDVPLISALRSPLWGFTADELSEIRTADRDADFYTALCAAAEHSEKCAGFLRTLHSWRALAPDLSLEELMGLICAQTDLFALCAAMPDGSVRRENVQRLLDLARQFEAEGWRGLFAFSAWLRRLAERGEEPPAGDADGAGRVRIMSIHKSKGLEFPVVFLADTGRQFNKADKVRTVLVHPKLGLGPKVTDLARGIEYPSLARRAVSLRIDGENLSEELRVLYVAMTRASERLYISCAWRDPEKVLEKLRDGLSSPLAPQLLESDRSAAHWLARAALLGDEALRLHVCRPEEEEATAPPAAVATVPGEAAADEGAFEELRRCLDWRYPCRAAEMLPSKVTATALRGLTPPDAEAAELTPSRFRPVYRYPDFGAAARPLTGAERGEATHLVLQLMDIRRAGTPEGIAEETARLLSLGHLTERQAEAVDVGAIRRFFQSETGRRVLGADRLWREFRFSLLCPADAWFDAPPGEEVLLQGVADCCIEEDGVLTVIDYKTDYVPPEGPAELAARYARQVRAYAGALARIFRKPVHEGILVFLRSGDAVSIPLE